MVSPLARLHRFPIAFQFLAVAIPILLLLEAGVALGLVG